MPNSKLKKSFIVMHADLHISGDHVAAATLALSMYSGAQKSVDPEMEKLALDSLRMSIAEILNLGDISFDKSTNSGRISCSFCGKDENSVRLAAGGDSLFVCNECSAQFEKIFSKNC